ncbi:hypothetical protein [Streptomyces sp. AC550_RSS872]|uniref:hypothetical protein n=1 Tax=Streptomyces sp. AC550_RSS872 TaxID=2823689 RepID=UPI001C276E60|nr:hypothetical protein [Streptomyces sp. AC550_RSS872]
MAGIADARSVNLVNFGECNSPLVCDRAEGGADFDACSLRSPESLASRFLKPVFAAARQAAKSHAPFRRDQEGARHHGSVGQGHSHAAHPAAEWNRPRQSDDGSIQPGLFG